MSEAPRKLVIWGASGHALVVADIIRLRGEYEIVGFLDDLHPERRDAPFGGQTVLGGREQLDHLYGDGVRHVIFGFGDNVARLALAPLVRARGLLFATAVHPRSTVAAGVAVGEGSVIAAGAVVNPAATIGKHVIVNTCASVDHECVLADGVHISPGAHLGGRVVVGQGAWIGIGAAVRDGVAVGANAVIGAGAAVVADIPSNVVAYGVPARVTGAARAASTTD